MRKSDLSVGLPVVVSFGFASEEQTVLSPDVPPYVYQVGDVLVWDGVVRSFDGGWGQVEAPDGTLHRIGAKAMQPREQPKGGK